MFNPKNDQARGIVTGLSSPQGRSLKYVGFKGNALTARIASICCIGNSVAPESIQNWTGAPSMLTVMSSFAWVRLTWNAQPSSLL